MNLPINEVMDEVKKTVKEWRDVPSYTYRFGAIEMPLANGHKPNSRWFKTKGAASQYAKENFILYAIARFYS